MNNTNPSQKPNPVAQMIVFGISVWVYLQSQPMILESNIRWIPACAAGLALMLSASFLVHILNGIAAVLAWLGSHQATGAKGTSRWCKYRDIKRELTRKREGPFWGMTVPRRQRLLFIDYVSNAMTIAPAGSGKGIYSVVPMGLSIRVAKVITDFKCELLPILKDVLQKRGEIVRVLNPSGLWSEIVGTSDSYNVIDIVTDNFYRPDGLRDVPDDVREINAQLLPEPSNAKGDDSYWREGSRSIMALVMLIEIMVEGYAATLSSVALLIEDRKALEHNLRWIVGIDLEGKPLAGGAMPIEQAEWTQYHSEQDVAEFTALIRARASTTLALMCNPDSKTFDSFISGAQQALAVYAFGRLAPAMRRSTFSMNDLKDAKVITSLFIVADSSKMATYKTYIGLIQWCALTALKRHENKKQPVYFILDEATNYKIHGLESLLTWGRSYGLRLHLIFQDLSAFEKTYGKTALETLLSETEIKREFTKA